MSDARILLALLCLLYFSECLLWINRHSIAFLSPWCAKWKMTFPSDLFSNKNAGLVFLNPLPPLGLAFVSHLLPISLSPFGICTYNSQTFSGTARPIQTPLTFRFNEINTAHADGKSLVVNGAVISNCESDSQASQLAALLTRLSATTDENRCSVVLDFLTNSLDRTRADTILVDVVSQTGSLCIFCNLLFAFLLILTPTVLALYGLGKFLFPIVGSIVVCILQISIEFYIAHKNFYPEQGFDRISNVIKMLLCPPVAIRARDLILTPALSSFNPLIVGDLMLERREYQRFVEGFMRDLKYPIIEDGLDSTALSIVAWHNKALFHECEQYLRGVAKIDIDVFAPPLKTDSHAESYCPRCRNQFTKREGECPDCSGVKLLRFGVSSGLDNE